MALSPKQQRFAELFVIDLNATQAYADAYGPKTRAAATSLGSRLLTNANIMAEVARLKAQVSQAVGETVEGIVRNLRTQYDAATTAKDRGNALRALELLGKHVGAFEKDNVQRALTLNLG